jgi:HPt (histidine-containing phosphotransfer) domain-containing protein
MKTNAHLPDLTYLKNISKGNREFELKMLMTFMEQTSEEAAKISKCLVEKDWDSLYASVHKIKPSFHFIGARKTEKLIVAIEEMAREQNELNKLPHLINKFLQSCRNDMKAVNAAIEKYHIETE